MKYILATILIIGTAMAQDYYKMTDVDVIEIKTIPAAALMESSANGNYFDHSGDLFRPLFKYIQSNNLTMTAPVEADVQKGKMRFFVEKPKKDDSLSSNEQVKVFRRPERTVLSIGIRGSYSDSNFEEGLAKLNEWLNNNKGWRRVGDPIAVYWNSPFNLWFMKRSEVQIPVERVQ
jgi:effector-binding domain-containing protein